MSKEKILNAARQFIRTAALLASAVCGPTAAAGTAGSTPTLAILPQSGLADEPVRIRLSGLGAGQMALVTATMQDDRGTLWVSSAEFKASDDGVIDNSSDAPARGSYEGADVTGLVWSMTPQVPKGMESTPYFKDPLGFTTIRITASLLAQRATTVVRDQTAVSLLAQQATLLYGDRRASCRERV